MEETNKHNYDLYSFNGELKESIKEDFTEMDLDNVTLYVSNENYTHDKINPNKEYKAVLEICDMRDLNFNEISVNLYVIPNIKDFDYENKFDMTDDNVLVATQNVVLDNSKEDEQKHRTDVEEVQELTLTALHLVNQENMEKWINYYENVKKDLNEID